MTMVGSEYKEIWDTLLLERGWWIQPNWSRKMVSEPFIKQSLSVTVVFILV